VQEQAHRGGGGAAIAPELWPIALFTAIVIAAAVYSYRETLE
jgi:hypothetical protein